jgi:hypothetical protein
MKIGLGLLALASAVVLFGVVGSAAFAAQPTAYTCSGGAIPGGTYSSLLVTGVCTFGGDIKVTGDVTVAAGATLNDHAAAPYTEKINGSVTVGAGAVLGLGSYATVPNDSQVNGDITADGPKSLYLSGMKVNGNVTSTGGGTGTSEFRNFPTKDDTINGNLTITGWQGGWLGVIRDTVRGNVTVSNNVSIVNCTAENEFGACIAFVPGVDPDSTEVATNVISGDLVCTGNTPAAQFGDTGGLPNVVRGSKLGECANL